MHRFNNTYFPSNLIDVIPCIFKEGEDCIEKNA